MSADTASAAHDACHDHELDALYRISQFLATGGGQRQVLADVLDVLHHELGMRRGRPRPENHPPHPALQDPPAQY